MRIDKVLNEVLSSKNKKLIKDIEKTKPIRVRFAPSPTGELHIGGLRTALTDFLFTRKNNGQFILRIEDTDRKRFVKGVVERIIQSLEWAGIKIDEGVTLRKIPNSKLQITNLAYRQAGKFKIQNNKTEVIRHKLREVGNCGPYTQSKRLDIYKKYVQQLLDDNKAYYCFCSAERLEKMRKEQQKNKQAPKYDRHCLELSQKEIGEKIKNGEKYTVRFKIPEGRTVFKDLVYGKIEVDNATLDDQVILKTDGFPTYHLAVVVDDYLMKISYVFRGAEWLPSMPKHILLYQALGWEKNMPQFCHMPNILNKNRRKLSKREGSVSVEDFRQQGYPAQAVINFIALLGWNPKTEQEIFTMPELIDQFDTEKMNRAGGVFDMDRLNWISAQHIKKMSLDELYKNILPFLKEKEFYKNPSPLTPLPKGEDDKKEYIKKVLAVERDRLEKFTQIGESNQFFFNNEIKITSDDMRWKDSSDADTKKYLEKASDVLKNISGKNWTKKNLEKILLKSAGENRGDLLFPLRVSLTGQKKSPSPFEVAWVLGKKETLKRITMAIKKIK